MLEVQKVYISFIRAIIEISQNKHRVGIIQTTKRLQDMRSILLLLLLFTGFTLTSQANGGDDDGQVTLNLDGIFALEFKKEILKVLGNEEPTVFKTPIRGMQLYGDQVKLYGQLVVGSGKVVGKGLLAIEGSLAKSDYFELGNASLKVPRGTFVVKSKNPSKPVLEVNDVEILYDFKAKSAKVRSLSRMERIMFPNSQMSVGFNSMLWTFWSTDIDLDMHVEGKKPNPLYVRSQSFKHKGLDFNAKHLTYNYNTKTINIEGVDGIEISNATVIPKDGLVRITGMAVIDTLKEAVVQFDEENVNHGLSKGDIIIESKEKYDGIANYEFVTYKGEVRKLRFTNFHLTSRNIEKDGKIVQISENVGESFIPETEKIEVMPGVLFFGKVILSDYEKSFSLDGKVALNVPGTKKNWINYNTIVNKKIQVNRAMKDAVSGASLKSGLYLDMDYRTLEGAFIESAESEYLPIFEAEGGLDYNEEGDFYVIEQNFGGATKKTAQVKRLNYHYNSQKLHFEGRLNLGENSKYFSQRVTGLGTFDKKTKELNMNTFLLLDFKAPKKLFDEMVFELDKQAHTLDARPTNKKTFQSQVMHMLGNNSDVIVEEGAQKFKFGEIFNESISLTDVNLKWSDVQSAFYSTGKIGLGNFYKMNLDIKVDGFVYIPKHENNIEIHFYFETNNEWFYFKRRGDQMYFRSSKSDYNGMLDGKKGRFQLLSEKEAKKMISIYHIGFEN